MSLHPPSLLLRGVPGGFLCLTFFFLFAAGHSSFAQATKEYQLKAVLLFRLAQFVEWPTNRFASPESPVVIGVLGKNPFGDALRAAVEGETANGRRIEITHLPHPSAASSYHIVFISPSEEPRVREILQTLYGQAVLTVSDIDNFVRGHGGMIRFVTVENKITLSIHADRAKAAGLAINSRLLRMAEIVRD